MRNYQIMQENEMLRKTVRRLHEENQVLLCQLRMKLAAAAAAAAAAEPSGKPAELGTAGSGSSSAPKQMKPKKEI